MKRSEGSRLQRRYSVNAVIHRTCGTGEVKDIVNRAEIKRFADVELHELKVWVIAEMGEIHPASGEQVIDNNHPPALAKQSIRQMGPEETGATRDQSAS